MLKPALSILFLLLQFSLVNLVTGCSSPAGKAATYKAKDASPLHDTKKEKATKKIEKLGD